MKTIQSLIKKTTLIASGIVMSSTTLAGGSIDLSLSNNTARIEYDAAKAGSGLHVSMAAQHHTENGSLAALGLHVVDVREPNSPLYIGVGGKLYGYQVKFDDNERYDGEGDHFAGALAVGGFLRYNIPQTDGLSVATYLYYAPEVVSFNDTENLMDFDLRLQYALIPTARVYAGYRHSAVNLVEKKTNTNVDSADLATGLHAGLKIDF